MTVVSPRPRRGPRNRLTSAEDASGLLEPGEVSAATIWWRSNERWLLGLAGSVIVLASWQLSASIHLVNPVFTSSPVLIARSGVKYLGTSAGWKDLRVSGTEFGLGFLFSLGVGLPMGVAMGWWKRFDALVEPVFNFLYASPRIALVPLFVIWFGIGTASKVAVVFLSSVFAIVLNTSVGVRVTDAALLTVSQAFRASKWQQLKTVVFPSALPSVVAGVRLGIGQGLIGMVVGELVASTAGLGYTMESAGNDFQTNLVFVALFLVAIVGVALSAALRMVERRLERWRPVRSAS